MSKQVLSVADFALILNIVNERLERAETAEPHDAWYEKDRVKKEETIAKYRAELKEMPLYKSLLHLKNSLENLNVEIETPDIELKDDDNDCPNNICAMH